MEEETQKWIKVLKATPGYAHTDYQGECGPDVTVDDAYRLFGIGTDQFLISWLDVP